jgi:hypothetical protein
MRDIDEELVGSGSLHGSAFAAFDNREQSTHVT